MTDKEAGVIITLCIAFIAFEAGVCIGLLMALYLKEITHAEFVQHCKNTIAILKKRNREVCKGHECPEQKEDKS